jgi:hypothetical protein
MAGFSQTVYPSELNDFVMGVRAKTGATRTDIISVAHPIYRALEKAGGIAEDEPGMGPVEDLLASTQDRTIAISQSSQFKDIPLAPAENFARASYDWIQLITSMVIGKFDYDNWQNGSQAFNYIKEKLAAQDIDMKTQIVSMLTGGRSEGSQWVNGTNDLCTFTPATDPTRGAVGKISVTNTKFPTWRNLAYNYNGAFCTYSSGTQVKTFLDDGTTSLLAMYLALGNTPEGEQGISGAFPDLLPVNMPMFLQCSSLATRRMLFRDQTQVDLLGVESFRYHNGAIFYDANVPNDPNNSTYGVMQALNTTYFKFRFARGLKKQWTPLAQVPGKTAYAAQESTQCTMTCKDRRRFGVFYGTQAISVA